MPSRLSSLLVRDGLVGVKRMEKAFQRQVIYGGSLDTILLEMGLVPEDRLTQYLALASGLPPAARDEGTVIDPAAVAVIPQDMAERFRVVPVALESDAIRILVCSPLELSELEDLADALDRPLQPLITPEYRWNLVFATTYGVDPPARFTTLARTLDVDTSAPPVGRAPTIIVDSATPVTVPSLSELTRQAAALPGGGVRLAPVASDADTLRLLTGEPLPQLYPDDLVRGRRHTIIGVTPARASTDSGTPSEDEATPPSGSRRAGRISGPYTSGSTPGSTSGAMPLGGHSGLGPAGRHSEESPSGARSGPGPAGRHSEESPSSARSGLGPAGGNSEQFPTTGRSGPISTGEYNEQFPTSGRSGPIPTGGYSEQFPTSGRSGPIPTGRHDDPIPASGHSGPIPTGRHSGPIPTGRHSGPIPTGGSDDPIPSSGRSGSIPTGGHDGPVSAGRHSGPIPTGRHSGPIPTGGHDDPIPSSGRSGSIPTGGHDGPVSAGRHSGPIPTGGHSGPIPVAGQSGPVPTGSGPATEPRVSGSRPIATARPTPIPTAGRDSPLPISRAREILANAADRDTVFLTLLRAARSRARWAGLLTVQGGAAIGRVALAEPGIDSAAISTVLIPLDAVSPFRTVVNNHQSHIGPLMSGDPGIDSMVLRFGGSMPPSALLLPIVLRDRVVALVVAHRLHSDLKLVDVTELLPMANAASEAIGRLIVKHKSAGRPPTDPGMVPIEAEMIDTKRISRADVAPSSPSAPPSARFEQGVEMSIEAGEPRAIDEVLSEIERAGEGAAEDAMAEAIERTPETLRALSRRFPGKLRVDRFSVTGRPLRAAQYGGLLELVVRLGSTAAELLMDKMSVAQRDVRFYATVCAVELRPRDAVLALSERLFDQDFGVRASALEALSGYPLTELGHALTRARRAVHSSDPDVLAAAAGALISLGDVDAIPDLIGVIERADRGGDHARRALTALTAQDFGASERKWRKWYDGARRRHRVEWLIEGLSHKEDAIRETAINALRRLTGEYFGYHHDLPRKERDAAAERWAAWWRDAGQRRFAAGPESERHRPTAELPPRREP